MIDERLKKAVRIVWVEKDFERGPEAKEILDRMAEEGNADAYYFLARCYAGTSYVDAGFGFPADDQKTNEYLDKCIRGGSALGMFSGRRFGGYEPPDGTFVHEPYHSMKEVWDAVCRIADSGELFTKYLVANAYYYGDVAKLIGVDLSQMPGDMANQQLRNWAEVAIVMYEELLKEDMIMGLGNYIDIITSGDYGVPKDEKRARELKQIGADKGNPYYMVLVGEEIEEEQPDKAEAYYLRALKHNYTDAYYNLGRLCTFRGKKLRDLKQAREFFEKCLQADQTHVGSNNLLGEIYYYGGDGIEKDYDKAFRHLLAACEQDNHWAYAMLGTCYLKGLGTAVDYEKARAEFSRYSKPCALAAVGLGEIYAYGLGVPVDINRAMSYWDRYPDQQTVIENKKNFKKTLFGWKRV